MAWGFATLTARSRSVAGSKLRYTVLVAPSPSTRSKLYLPILSMLTAGSAALAEFGARRGDGVLYRFRRGAAGVAAAGERTLDAQYRKHVVIDAWAKFLQFGQRELGKIA